VTDPSAPSGQSAPSAPTAPAGMGEIPLYIPRHEPSLAEPAPRNAGTPPVRAGHAEPGHAEPGHAEPGDKAKEVLVSAFFLVGALAGVAFVVIYWSHAKATDNWVNGLLGLTMAISLGGMGAGAVLWAKLLMPHEVAVQEREPFGSPPEYAEAAGVTWNAAVEGTGIARRPLLRRSLLLASGAIALPGVAILRSLNEKPKGAWKHTHWASGTRMVDQFNNPIRLGDLETNAIATVFPENFTDPDSAASSAVLLLNIPVADVGPKIAPKAYQGYVAFSKICTHAGCPASLYDQQTHTLICPCHQSQFKILEGCKPVSGPATRPLPQLAVGVDDVGYLIAHGDFDEPVGPGFWER